MGETYAPMKVKGTLEIVQIIRCVTQQFRNPGSESTRKEYIVDTIDSPEQKKAWNWAISVFQKNGIQSPNLTIDWTPQSFSDNITGCLQGGPKNQLQYNWVKMGETTPKR